MKNKLNIIYAGTPQFAVPPLEILAKSNFLISCVLTQPDKRAGRGMKIIQSPVKEKALELSIPVLQPESLKDDLIYAEIKGMKADIFIVAAYGLIIPQRILDLFDYGTLNLHASLLPRWRGAAPIHRAIEAGDEELGVTIMKVVQKLDAGPMIKKASIINDNLTTGVATEKLSILGAKLIKDVISDLKDGKVLSFEEQDESDVSYAEKINKLEAKLNFANNPKQLIQKINAFNPSPGLHYLFRGKLIKIWQAEIAKEDFHNHKYGYFSVQFKRLFLGVKGGAIEIKEIQIEGKSKMSAIEFIDGYQIDHQELLLNE
jgi:methionyl-tRNA formyltransferase